MKPRKIWANLGVENLERSSKFYSALGFKSNGASEELTSFFFGEEDFIIHFFRKEILKDGMKGEILDLTSGNEIIFTLSAGSREEVDSWEEEVRKAGGSIISEAEEFGKGYYGFVFADPDGHRFNVFFM